MSVSIERKYRLIEEIMQLDDEITFSTLEQQVRSTPSLQEAIKPIKKSTSLDAMKREQGYHPPRREEFFRKTQELAIQEPLEDLLQMLD